MGQAVQSHILFDSLISLLPGQWKIVIKKYFFIMMEFNWKFGSKYNIFLQVYRQRPPWEQPTTRRRRFLRCPAPHGSTRSPWLRTISPSLWPWCARRRRGLWCRGPPASPSRFPGPGPPPRWSATIPPACILQLQRRLWLGQCRLRFKVGYYFVFC